MLRSVKRKIVLTQAVFLLFFAVVGGLYLAQTIMVNPLQLRWELYCLGWEVLALGIPLIGFQPMFRRIARDVRRIDAGEVLSATDIATYHRLVLSYPLRVAMFCLFGSIFASKTTGVCDKGIFLQGLQVQL